MRTTRDYLDGLVQLHRLQSEEERTATWRQSMATLAASVESQRRAVPLEGFHPEALQASVRAAMNANLLDELDWLSAPAAAAALYELAAALPPGAEKREIGRRVLLRLNEGDAATFIALATRLAMGSSRTLSGAGTRARVALSLDLPYGVGARADGLALAMISRRELEREWLTLPSTGSLPARRLAARLLERAARESAARAAQGDDSGLRVFESPSVRAAWNRLLADRESLVWRHVATARGLLMTSVPAYAAEITKHLSPKLTATEWRRGAASLAASVAVRPEAALAQARAVLDGEIVRRDPGIAGAMILALARAADAEPAAAEELLEACVRVGGLEAAEAVVDLGREQLGTEFGLWASQLARAQLLQDNQSGDEPDDGHEALVDALDRELEGGHSQRATLHDLLEEAILAFAQGGPTEGYRRARQVLTAAESRVELLERCTDDTAEERRTGFRVLRELDLALFETASLGDLLALGARGDDTAAMTRPLADVFERVTQWLVLREYATVRTEHVEHVTLRRRRLRTMLHLVDADGSHVDARTGKLRERRLATARMLLERARDDAAPSLRRTACAAAARGLDALVREEIAEVSDVLIAIASHLRAKADLETIAEASMVPEIEGSVQAYAALDTIVRVSPQTGSRLRASLDSLRDLAHELPVASSPRVEALRASFLELARALEQIASATSLTEIAEGPDAMLNSLESAAHSLAQLVSGARRRIGQGSEDEMPASGAAVRLIDFCLERALRGTREPLADAISSTAETLRLELPSAVAEVAAATLARITNLPDTAPARAVTSFAPAVQKEAPLPAWMPPSRTLGGFYVVRALGSGGGGSVFVARRLEDRNDSKSEQFALKVPEYDGAAARTLSEAEFMQLFREEAGALLAVPQHANLARFVTFDAGARPKPILVMELVEGQTLERVLETAELDMRRAFELLDGLAAALEAMHRVGVGHLDVKPSNVILRESDGKSVMSAVNPAVLVDFGLAGRKVRPGCATAEYGAPEIWGLGDAERAGPTPADVYAFGCVAFEVLTGQTLFDEPNEVGTITAHISHDGEPERLAPLTREARTSGVVRLLAQALRRSPQDRAPMRVIRAGLAELKPALVPMQWPLPT